MTRLQIGVMNNSFRTSPYDGIRKAKELGADGVQIDATHGELRPDLMDRSTRRHLREYCADLGLQISALCGDLGGHGFQIEHENPMRIETSKLIIDLAADLHTRVVTSHLGIIPMDRSSKAYGVLYSVCRELGSYAEQAGVTYAIETGPERAPILSAFLRDVGSTGIGVNLDPANFVMVTAEDPIRAVYLLKDYIVHTHAKDAIKLDYCDPVWIYGVDSGTVVETVQHGEFFREVPLGWGAIDWDAYLKALQDIGYQGFLTIEREVGDDPASDIREAVSFLRHKIASLTAHEPQAT